jgi:AAHS family 4-hydroxybenzoate transporter-like MFS transporter
MAAADRTPAGTLDVREVIDNAPFHGLHYQIVTLCALCMIMDGFDVQAPGYVAPAIIQDWKIAPALLGPVFGASNFGVLIGQLCFPVLADRIGRRPVLIAGTVAFAVLTILTGMVNNLTQLLVMRLIAGAAMGSIIPNATALVSEYSPARKRIALVTYLGLGFTVGAAVGGFVAAWLIPMFGWRSVFYFGGAVPLVLGVAMLLWLPESLLHLTLRGKKTEYVRDWLRRVNPTVPISSSTQLVTAEQSRTGTPIAHLFREGRGVATVLLWVVNFMNLFTLYSLANWLPTVVRGAGYPTSTAVLIGTTLQVGGSLSPFLFAWAVVRKGFIPVLGTVFAIATVAIATIGQPGLTLTWLAITVFVAGACIVGAQPTLNTLAATYYPTYLRSTGLGWALGIGRGGSIVGPVLAGQFLAWQWGTRDIFFAMAVPTVISVIAILLLRQVIGARSAVLKPTVAASAPSH